MTPNVPWEFLEICSDTSLENLILSELNQSEKLRKQLRVLRGVLFDKMVTIQVAEMLLKQRDKLAHIADVRQQAFDFEKPEPKPEPKKAGPPDWRRWDGERKRA